MNSYAIWFWSADGVLLGSLDIQGTFVSSDWIDPQVMRGENAGLFAEDTERPFVTPS